jgi:hypothetical protein
VNEQKKENPTNSATRWAVGCLIICILFCLTLIAWPSFYHYSAYGYGSEGKQNLGAIYTAYQSYLSDNNTYPSSPFIQHGTTSYNCIEIADYMPKGRRYSYKCMDTIVFGPQNENNACCNQLKVKAHADSKSFTVIACMNMESDEFCDAWSIDDAKHLRQISDGVSNNWRYNIKRRTGLWKN